MRNPNRHPSPLVFLLPDVVAHTGLGRTSIYNAIGNGPRSDPSFPRPIATGVRRRAWVAEEIRQWVADKVAQRDN